MIACTTTAAISDNAVLSRLIALKSMNTADLKALWLKLYGSACAKHFTSKSLIPKLSYRIQELAYGGLDSNTEARLAHHAQSLSKHKSNGLLPPTGTVLARVYRGVEYQVAVLDNGKLQYNGCEYRSLSGIAKEITGMSWNGLEFFGLKQRKTRML
jgi:hypothetical protein